MANYTLNQGETFRVTLELQDAGGDPILIASEALGVYSPHVYFAGVATLSGQSPTDIKFKMQEPEEITYGRGAVRYTATGVFKIYAYIPADMTISMAPGDWAYEIRQSDEANPDTVNAPHAVATVLEGTITIKDGPLDNTDGVDFTFDAPATP